MDGSKTTVTEAAKRLGVTTRTVYRWLDSGKIKESGRAGNAILLSSDEVDRLARERGGVPAAKSMTLAEVYVRLTDAEEWADVDAIRKDMAAVICSTAAEVGPLVKAWEAACSMAATNPDDEERGRWAATAQEYGRWLGRSDDETARAISHKAQRGSFTTYGSAMAESEAAPADPAYVIAAQSIESKQ